MPSDEEPTSGSPPAAAIQAKVVDYWARTGVIERALADRPGAPIFRFTEGPPGANGRPHIGHVIPRALKDVQLRYHRMLGHRIVSSMAGWDCHGLPVEIAVEKKFGLRSAKEIEAFGVDRFCEESRAITLSMTAAWEELSGQIGYWLDYRNAYQTMAPAYIESVWWSLKALFDRGLVEKGHYVLPYCPRCETTLSSHEVAQGYRETTDPSVTVRFPLLRPGAPPRDLLVWTTTPWTLVSNLFVVARADLDYVVVRDAVGREVVLAETALPRYFSMPPDVLERFTGRDLAGAAYEPPFPFADPTPGRFHVVLDDMVDAKEGTGFVHGAPSFGPDDYRVGVREKIGTLDPLDSRAHFTSAIPLVDGRFFKAADPILIEDLRTRERVYRQETVHHTYPFCWRCETPLIYRAMDSWFVRTSRFSEALVRHNATTTWIPTHLRDGRFGNFLTEAKDWAISRSRYWGTPLPLWVCSNGHPTCVGSFEELSRRWGRELTEDFDPHRVGVDPIVFPCPTCAAPSRREPYTLDVWYDSGAAPFAQFHHPFARSDFVAEAPLDYVCEGIDQTRGWFYTMLVLSTALFDRPAFRTALVTGFGLDDIGKKMSKSKGNIVDPVELLARVGGDAVRWFSLMGDFTEGTRMSESEMRSSAARTLGTLTNVLAFYRQNASADGLSVPTEPPRTTDPLDRWILSRLEATRTSVSTALDDFDPRPGALALRSFIDDLSTWYLRRSRPRFWADRDHRERREAHATLGFVLGRSALLLAPLAPFTAEWIAQELAPEPWARAESSVHLAAWPSGEPARNEPLEAAMDSLRSLVEIGRELRQRAGVRSRIPLTEVVLFGAPPPELSALGGTAHDLLAQELNVRSVRREPEFTRDRFPDSAWVTREHDGRIVAALPRVPTPELLEEGMAREVLRRLQQRRKELGLAFTDRIALDLIGPEALIASLERRRDLIERELLVDRLTLRTGGVFESETARSWEVDGVQFAGDIARSPVPTPARPRRPVSARRRPRPRNDRPGSRASARPRGRARPSRTSRRGTSRRPTPARRRPAAKAARSRRAPKRSARAVRPRHRLAVRRRPRRRSARGK